MAKPKSGLQQPGLEQVVLDHDHWHAGEFYPAGKPIPVTPKRKKYFSTRGWIVDPQAGTKGKEGKEGPKEAG